MLGMRTKVALADKCTNLKSYTEPVLGGERLGSFTDNFRDNLRVVEDSCHCGVVGKSQILAETCNLCYFLKSTEALYAVS